MIRPQGIQRVQRCHGLGDTGWRRLGLWADCPLGARRFLHLPQHIQRVHPVWPAQSGFWGRELTASPHLRGVEQDARMLLGPSPTQRLRSVQTEIRPKKPVLTKHISYCELNHSDMTGTRQDSITFVSLCSVVLRCHATRSPHHVPCHVAHSRRGHGGQAFDLFRFGDACVCGMVTFYGRGHFSNTPLHPAVRGGCCVTGASGCGVC